MAADVPAVQELQANPHVFRQINKCGSNRRADGQSSGSVVLIPVGIVSKFFVKRVDGTGDAVGSECRSELLKSCNKLGLAWVFEADGWVVAIRDGYSYLSAALCGDLWYIIVNHWNRHRIKKVWGA